MRTTECEEQALRFRLGRVVIPSELHCAEVLGGTHDTDLDISVPTMTVSLFSAAADGGKGGDVYYLTVCENNTINRVVVADVAGHGDVVNRVSRGIYDAFVAGIADADGTALLSEVNRVASGRGHGAMTTAVVMSFLIDGRSLRLASAGHPPIWIRHAWEGRWKPLGQPHPELRSNLPLGAFPDSVFEEERLPLCSGDRLFVYTDGVIEAQDGAGEPFGQERLHAALERAAGGSALELKRQVLAGVRAHTGGPLAHDDVTMMAVEMH